MFIFDMFVEVFGRIPVEIPKCETIKSTADYEIRKYPPVVVAQVTYDRSKVKDKDGYGFEILADYIGVLGKPKNMKNTAPEQIAMTAPVITKDAGESEKIGMTSPVITKDGGQSEKIEMTAPVITKEGPPESIDMTAPVVTKEGEGDVVTMQFLLPQKYTSLAEVPRPLDEKVELKEEGEKKYAVTKFSGVVRSLQDKIAVEKTEKLRSCLEKDGYRIVGEPVLARYNPPWTLPFLRTNEIMIPIE